MFQTKIEPEKVKMSHHMNKASFESATRMIENLEDIYEISTKYVHKDKSFEDYDYDIHHCNKAQYDNYQNDIESTEKNLVNNDRHKEKESMTQAYFKVKNTTSMDKDCKNHIKGKEALELMDKKDVKDKPTYDCNFDMNHRIKLLINWKMDL